MQVVLRMQRHQPASPQAAQAAQGLLLAQARARGRGQGPAEQGPERTAADAAGAARAEGQAARGEQERPWQAERGQEGRIQAPLEGPLVQARVLGRLRRRPLVCVLTPEPACRCAKPCKGKVRHVPPQSSAEVGGMGTAGRRVVPVSLVPTWFVQLSAFSRIYRVYYDENCVIRLTASDLASESFRSARPSTGITKGWRGTTVL
mmetsp:Transcript_4950/g.10873  ORF Transcript_4950/g.10873 Transcript_4950/m.10873 type:complete len:204 (+) Transcript_4950:1644-2255(+)